jgi:hypothetical protein
MSLAKAIIPSFSKFLEVNWILGSPITEHPTDPYRLIPIDQTKKGKRRFVIHVILSTLVFCRAMLMGIHAIRVSYSSAGEYDEFSKAFSDLVSFVAFICAVYDTRLLVDRVLVCQLIQSWIDVSKFIGEFGTIKFVNYNVFSLPV